MHASMCGAHMHICRYMRRDKETSRQGDKDTKKQGGLEGPAQRRGGIVGMAVDTKGGQMMAKTPACVLVRESPAGLQPMSRG